MKNTAVLMSITLFFAMSFFGCKPSKSISTSSIHHIPEFTVDTVAEIRTEEYHTEAKKVTPYTGEEVGREVIEHIPFMAIVENSREARPQSGLSEADIVYETMAEGGIPRFIALFHKNSPKVVGPIRSARPYFINITKEYNLAFGHCGGSEEALISIKNENLMSLNEFIYGSYYWRDSSRKAPHNLYTSAEKLRNVILSKGYNKEVSNKPHFDTAYWNNSSLPTASSVNLKLNRYYNTNYEFANKEYQKYMDNDLSIDKGNNKPVTADNIVIQITVMRLQPDGSHLDIDLTGRGEGYIISRGRYVKGKWSKEAMNSPTVFTDESGKVIPLFPGKTWWHIVDKNCIVEFK